MTPQEVALLLNTPLGEKFIETLETKYVKPSSLLSVDKDGISLAIHMAFYEGQRQVVADIKQLKDRGVRDNESGRKY